MYITFPIHIRADSPGQGQSYIHSYNKMTLDGMGELTFINPVWTRDLGHKNDQIFIVISRPRVIAHVFANKTHLCEIGADRGRHLKTLHQASLSKRIECDSNLL